MADIDNGGAHASAQLSVTWTFTETYRRVVPLPAVADAARRSADELRADPSLLHGVVSDQVADLLTSYQDDTHVIGAPEVEITDTYLAEQPTIAALVNQARQALQAESDADQPSHTGHALAALLAGLVREQLIGW